MSASQPLVLEGIGLLSFIQYILKTHMAPSTLVVCSSKEYFLQHLNASLATSSSPGSQDEDIVQQRRWLAPTLRSLASSRTLKIVFCPELPHLRAYLATYAHSMANLDQDQKVAAETSRLTRTLAILNSVELHRPTSAFSAQGLNRTLSVAVEAAHFAKSRLVLAECPSGEGRKDGEELSMDVDSNEAGRAPFTSNTWDEEVSILNVTTKSFGAGERGWVGRTVKVRTIAERWCVFEDLRHSKN